MKIKAAAMVVHDNSGIVEIICLKLQRYYSLETKKIIFAFSAF